MFFFCRFFIIFQATDTDTKSLFVRGPSERKVTGIHLRKMIDRETTVPGSSFMFIALSNTFIPLDIMSVQMTGDQSVQFSTLEDGQVKATEEFITKLYKLQDWTIRGNTTTGEFRMFRPWDLWSALKHRGLADVDVFINEKGTKMMKVGEVKFAFNDLAKFISEAKFLLQLANI